MMMKKIGHRYTENKANFTHHIQWCRVPITIDDSHYNLGISANCFVNCLTLIFFSRHNIIILLLIASLNFIATILYLYFNIIYQIMSTYAMILCKKHR